MRSLPAKLVNRGWRTNEQFLISGWTNGKASCVVVGHGGNVTCANLKNRSVNELVALGKNIST